MAEPRIRHVSHRPAHVLCPAHFRHRRERAPGLLGRREAGPGRNLDIQRREGADICVATSSRSGTAMGACSSSVRNPTRCASATGTSTSTTTTGSIPRATDGWCGCGSSSPTIPTNALVLRRNAFDRQGEIRIPLPRYAQAVVDSERLFHSGFNKGPTTRYALITSVESTPGLQDWIRAHRA